LVAAEMMVAADSAVSEAAVPVAAEPAEITEDHRM